MFPGLERMDLENMYALLGSQIYLFCMPWTLGSYNTTSWFMYVQNTHAKHKLRAEGTTVYLCWISSSNCGDYEQCNFGVLTLNSLERAGHISVFSVRSKSRKKPAKSTQETKPCLPLILASLTLQSPGKRQYVPPKCQALSLNYTAL
jgi:hypothetical protein